MDYFNAFWIGGLICALVQILLDRTKLMPGRVMVLLVCGGAILGALKIYQPFQELAGAGASVPLLGFGNLLWNGVKEAVDQEGIIGIFTGGLGASAAGTGGTSLRGRVWVRSGRFMPFFAMASPQTSLLGMDCFLAVRF